MLLLLGLLLPAPGAATFIVDVDATTRLHPTNPLYMGCHSDSGFVHQVRGWSSQLVFGESFESPPNTTVEGQSSYAWQKVGSSAAKIASDPTRSFAGFPSQKIQLSSGTAGLANRGLGNEGLYLRAGKPYEGYFFARSDAPVQFEVRLETSDASPTVLATQTVSAASSEDFVQYHFTLTPSQNTECVGIEPHSDPSVHCTTGGSPAHICVKCGGQITVALVGPGEANIAYVVLQPGSWGRFKGLNARKDVADTMMQMGIKIIRLGGSFCSVGSGDGEFYQWQKWTGPVWKRPSVGAHWDSYSGNAYNLIGGWGPFEMIDYAAALGAEPVITTTMTSSPEEFADLIEYCHGNASTKFGQQRIADGHPDAYKLRYIELGNEQYNHDYIAQVTAMEERARSLGVDDIHYIFPSNGGLAGDDVKAAAALGLGNKLVTDIHVGAGGALDVADQLYEAHASGGLGDDAAVNFETNAGSHHLGRALDEAADLNKFFNKGDPRMLARTASFCHGRAGHFDEFDQAISFFLPNMTWLQPPAHVHAMITESWQPTVVGSKVSISPPLPPPSYSTHVNLGYNCLSGEYQGQANMEGDNSPAGCLAAVKKMADQGINFGTYPGNNNCYVCIVPGNITAKLIPKPNATTFVGTGVIAPPSVSSQVSSDGGSVVVRIVNHGTEAADVSVRIKGVVVEGAVVKAVTLASDDLNAENTAGNVANVAPRLLKVGQTESGTVSIVVPGQSYTVITV